MRKLVYFIGASLDGRIAGPNEEIDFFPTGNEQQTVEYMNWVNARYPETVPTMLRPLVGLEGTPNREFDTVIMGWNSYALALQQGTVSPYRHLTQFVASRNHTDTQQSDVHLTNDPTDLVRRLKHRDGRDIWLCGGGRLAGALMPEVDELIVKHYPVIAGAGPTLTDGPFAPVAFRSEHIQSFTSGVRIMRYTRS